ncbi:DUF4190 domain-containing protein [Actinoplanes sp. NPDC051859]|uniref:DUF4190 domain-containing protein n=1 Tax=Actinoplanes sp. NPDC051859 TaxID=3363909 RepID=UPI0037A23F37
MNSQAYGYAGPQGPAGYPASPYSYQQFPPPVAPSTDNMAIASLVVSCASVLGLCGFWVGGLLGIVGAILGHVARSRIARTGAGGGGMALAGIIVGWIVAALTVLTMVGLVALIANDSSRTF